MSESNFDNWRDAVCYALSQRQGPQAARPSLGGGAKGFRSPWDASAVRACMRSIGIEPDSEEERKLYDGARGIRPAPRELVRRLEAKLDEHDLLKREPLARFNLELVTWTDPDTGAELSSVTTLEAS